MNIIRTTLAAALVAFSVPALAQQTTANGVTTTIGYVGYLEAASGTGYHFRVRTIDASVTPTTQNPVPLFTYMCTLPSASQYAYVNDGELGAAWIKQRIELSYMNQLKVAISASQVGSGCKITNAATVN